MRWSFKYFSKFCRQLSRKIKTSQITSMQCGFTLLKAGLNTAINLKQHFLKFRCLTILQCPHVSCHVLNKKLVYTLTSGPNHASWTWLSVLTISERVSCLQLFTFSFLAYCYTCIFLLCLTVANVEKSKQKATVAMMWRC